MVGQSSDVTVDRKRLVDVVEIVEMSVASGSENGKRTTRSKMA